MELNISNIDIVVILLFVVGIIWWALKNRKNENASEYFLAGKSQNWFVVGSSLFAASVSSSTLMGHSGEGFISGIAVFNYNVGAIFVIIFVSLFFLPFYIKSGIYTIPEYLGRRFDNRSRKYFSFITIIGNDSENYFSRDRHDVDYYRNGFDGGYLYNYRGIVFCHQCRYDTIHNIDCRVGVAVDILF